MQPVSLTSLSDGICIYETSFVYSLPVFLFRVNIQNLHKFKLQGNKGSAALGGRNLFMTSSVLGELHSVFFVLLVGNLRTYYSRYSNICTHHSVFYEDQV